MNELNPDAKEDFLDWQKHDHYALLGITRMAGEDEIRKGYRRRALDCHPDRFPLDSAARSDAEDRFRKLTEARDTLLDAARREAYDSEQALTQQAWLDAMVSQYQAQVPINPPKKTSSAFKDTLMQAFEQANAEEHSPQADFTVGQRHAPRRASAQDDSDDDEPPPSRGLPEHSRRNVAAYYYSQGVRFAARGQYRRALFALNNAKLLDPDIEISSYLFNKVRSHAYFSKR